MSIIKILDTATYLKQFNNQPKSLRLISDCLSINNEYYAEYYTTVKVTALVDPVTALPKSDIEWEYNNTGEISNIEFSNYNSEMSFFVDALDGSLDISAKTKNNKQDRIQLNFTGVQIKSVADIGIEAPDTAMTNIESTYLISFKITQDSTRYNEKQYYIYNGNEYDFPWTGEDDNIIMSPGGPRHDNGYIWDDNYVTFKNTGTYKFVFYCENIQGESFEVSCETTVTEAVGRITSIYCPEGGYSFNYIGERKTFNFEVEYDIPNATSFESIDYEYDEHPSGVYKVISKTKDSITIECTGEGSADLYVYSPSDYTTGYSVTAEFIYASITGFDVDPSSYQFNWPGESVFIGVSPTYNTDYASGYGGWDVEFSQGSNFTLTKETNGLSITCNTDQEFSEGIYIYSVDDMSIGTTITVSYTPSDAPDVEEDRNCIFTIYAPGLNHFLTSNSGLITNYSITINGYSGGYVDLGYDIIDEYSNITKSELKDYVNRSYYAELHVDFIDDYSNDQTYTASANVGEITSSTSGKINLYFDF